MKRVLILFLLASVCAAGQTTTKKNGKPAKVEHKAAAVDATLLQNVWDAWCTLKAQNPAKFYDQAADDIFYDIQPLEYHGWSEYQKGVQPFLDSLRSASAKVDEVKVHPSGAGYWATAIVHFTMVPKQGSKSAVDVRWTSVWEKHGTAWKIIHEHVSAPMK